MVFFVVGVVFKKLKNEVILDYVNVFGRKLNLNYYVKLNIFDILILFLLLFIDNLCLVLFWWWGV